MPIHDQGYRRYAGSKTPPGRGWIVIARAGIREFFAKRSFLLLVLAGWGPFLFYAVTIFLAVTFPQANSILSVSRSTFHDLLDSTLVNLIVFAITVYAGAGLIANDRRANALQIYLSKPLTRIEYVIGKFAILASFLLLVTWLPAVVLLIVQAAFAGNTTFLMTNLFLFPAITVFAFIEVTVRTITILALSSLSNSSRYVGIMYSAVIFFSSAVFGVLYLATRSTSLSWISFTANLSQVGNVIFRLPLKYDTPWLISLFMIVAVIGVSGLILERRVRGVEVVA